MALREYKEKGVLKKKLTVQADKPEDLEPMLGLSEEEVNQYLPKLKEELGKDDTNLRVSIKKPTRLAKSGIFLISRGAPAMGFVALGFGEPESAAAGASLITGGNMFYDLYGKEKLNPSIHFSLTSQESERQIPRVEKTILRQGIGRKIAKPGELGGVP